MKLLKTALPSNIQSFNPEVCFEILNLSNYLTAIDRSSVTEHCTYFDRDFFRENFREIFRETKDFVR